MEQCRHALRFKIGNTWGVRVRPEASDLVGAEGDSPELADGVVGAGGAQASPGAKAKAFAGKLVERAKTSPLALGGGAFVAASAAVNGSNFTFHAIISRMLGPAGYGELSALLNLTVVLAVPLGALEAAVTRSVAARCANGEPLGMRRLSVQAGTGGALVFGLWVAVSPLVGGFLHLATPLPLLVIGAWVVPAGVGAVWQGLLIGQRRFRPVATAQVLGSGVARLAVGAALVGVGLGVYGALLATVGAGLVTLVLLFASVRPHLGRSAACSVSGSDALWTVASLGGVATMTTLDAWLARHFLAPSVAGYFNAGSTAGRIALFLPGTIVLVAFPRMAAGRGRTPQAHRDLLRTCFWVAAAAMSAAEVLVGVPGLVASVLFGHSFADTRSVIGILASADAAVALVIALVYFELARHSRLSVAGWLGCALMTLLATLFHSGMVQLAWMMVAANFTTLAILLGVAMMQCRGDRRHWGSETEAEVAAPSGEQTSGHAVGYEVAR